MTNVSSQYQARFLLLLMLISLSSIILYTYSRWGYSHLPTQWGVGSGWGRMYLIENNKIPNVDGEYYWVNVLRGYGASDPLPKILAAILSLVTGFDYFADAERFHRMFPWVGTIFMPIIATYSYRTFNSKSINILDLSLVILFSIFTLHSLVRTMSLGLSAANSVARVMLVFLLILCIKAHQDNDPQKRRIMILILLTISFINFHHTWTYYYTVFIIVLFIYSIYTSHSNLAVLYSSIIIIFASNSLYLNRQTFFEPIRYILFSEMIENPISSILSAPIGLLQTITRSETGTQVYAYSPLPDLYSNLQIIASLSIVFIYFLFLYKVYRYRMNEDIHRSYLFLYCIGLATIGVLLFIRGGAEGLLSRIFEPSTYIAILVSSYLLIHTSGVKKNAVRMLMIIIIISSIYSITIDKGMENRNLTLEEQENIESTSDIMIEGSHIYSDFRIGPVYILYNEYQITTIDARHQSEQEHNAFLNGMYYDIYNDNSINSDNERIYIVHSKRYQETGLLGASLQYYKPPSESFIDAWDRQNGYSKVYESEIVVYSR